MQLLLRQLKKSTIKFNENPIGIIRKCLYIIIIQDYLDIQSMHPILISNQGLLGFDLSGYPGVTRPKIEKDRQIAMTKKREREREGGSGSIMLLCTSCLPILIPIYQNYSRFQIIQWQGRTILCIYLLFHSTIITILIRTDLFLKLFSIKKKAKGVLMLTLESWRIVSTCWVGSQLLMYRV